MYRVEVDKGHLCDQSMSSESNSSLLVFSTRLSPETPDKSDKGGGDSDKP